MEATIITAIIGGGCLITSALIAFRGIYVTKKLELDNTKEIEKWKKNLEIKWSHIYPNVVKNYNEFIDLYVMFKNYSTDYTSPGVGAFTPEKIEETQKLIQKLINLLIDFIKMEILLKIKEDTKDRMMSLISDLKLCLMDDSWIKNPQTREHVKYNETYERWKLMIEKIDLIKMELTNSFSKELDSKNDKIEDKIKWWKIMYLSLQKQWEKLLKK